MGKKDISEEELKAELLKLGQEYNDKVKKCTKIHEEKIKSKSIKKANKCVI